LTQPTGMLQNPDGGWMTRTGMARNWQVLHSMETCCRWSKATYRCTSGIGLSPPRSSLMLARIPIIFWET